MRTPNAPILGGRSLCRIPRLKNTQKFAKKILNVRHSRKHPSLDRKPLLSTSAIRSKHSRTSQLLPGAATFTSKSLQFQLSSPVVQPQMSTELSHHRTLELVQQHERLRWLKVYVHLTQIHEVKKCIQSAPTIPKWWEVAFPGTCIRIAQA